MERDESGVEAQVRSQTLNVLLAKSWIRTGAFPLTKINVSRKDMFAAYPPPLDEPATQTMARQIR